MADDPHQRGARDRERINVHEDYELRYWSHKFNITPEQLKEVVGKVGVMVKDVEAELSK